MLHLIASRFQLCQLILLTAVLFSPIISAKLSARPSLLSAATPIAQTPLEYYISELEFETIQMDDYLIDYMYDSYTTTCDSKVLAINAERAEKFLTYTEQQLTSSLKGMIIFANDNFLKINVVGLLADSSLITFIDDATTSKNINNNTADSTKLISVRVFPAATASKCSGLIKTSSTSFILECQGSTSTTTSLIRYSATPTSTFSSPTGIDLATVTP